MTYEEFEIRLKTKNKGYCWSTGVLEYWARKNYLESLLHHSIIPSLH
jgi:hypothetical protein